MKRYTFLLGLLILVSFSLTTLSCKKDNDEAPTPSTGLKVGEIAPDFTLPDQDGNEVTLSNFRGQVVLVDFWASWCHFCRDENPGLVDLYATYESQGFEILGVSVDDNRDNWLAAVAADQINYVQLSDLKAWESEVVATYDIQSVPHMLLLDQEGTILLVTNKASDVKDRLEQLFK